MQKSESIKELATALAKAQGAFEHAKKDTQNEFFKSRYADLASVISAGKKPLSDNGLSVCQICEVTESNDIILETILMHVSGEWISGKYPVRPVKTDPQAMGSAITYARRYSFSAITGIASEEDDDGNSASAKPSTTTQKPPVPESPPINYAATLERAATLQALGLAWQKIPKELHPQFVALKDELKARLSPLQQVA